MQAAADGPARGVRRTRGRPEGAAGVTAVTPAAPGGPAAPGVCSRDAQATSLLLSAELWASEHDELKRSADAQRSRSAAEG